MGKNNDTFFAAQGFVQHIERTVEDQAHIQTGRKLSNDMKEGLRVLMLAAELPWYAPLPGVRDRQ